MNKIKNQSGFGVIELIIVVAVLALLGFGGWYMWQVNQKPAAQGQSGSVKEDPNTVKISDLGVEFQKKGGFEPVYEIGEVKSGDISYRQASFTTRELVNEGMKTNNTCDLSVHPIATLRQFNKEEDAVAVISEISRKVTVADLTRDNGFFKLGGKIYYVSQGAEGGAGLCTENAELEIAQGELLRTSLMTLRSVQ